MSSTMLRRALIILALAALTVVVYAPVRQFDFVQLDDPTYVVENPVVSRGLTLDGIGWAFTTGHAANWHPVTWLSHMLDVQLFGLAAGPHHTVNLALHVLNVILLFLVLEWMTGQAWPSAFVSALFAVHPLHVESVAWVAERKDVLSTTFWMLTMLAYAWYARSARRAARLAYVLVLLFYALGLMAKPMLVTLPFVLLLLDWWPLGRLQERREAEGGRPLDSADDGPRPARGSRKAPRLGRRRSAPRSGQAGDAKPGSPEVGKSKDRSQQARTAPGPGIRHSIFGIRYSATRPLLVEKLPLFALAAVSSVITIVVQQRGGAVTGLQAIPLGMRLGNAALSSVRYLTAMAWPTDLTVIYPIPDALPIQAVIGSVVFLLVVSVAAVAFARRAPYLLVGWWWYLGTLVPVSGLIQVGLQARADRYTYVPLVGVFVAIAWGGAALVARRRVVRAVVLIAACAALLGFVLATMQQLGYWKDDVTLWTHATMVTLGVDEYEAHVSLGRTLGDQGRIDEAARHFEEAIRLQPNQAAGHAYLGITLARQGKVRESLRSLEEAARLDPTNETTRQMLQALRAKMSGS